ncbi:MAG: ABC transporter ATP-binding protein/permease [Chloroflexi bacterium]|nr:ABC transporter ATP-binding protein/permease [Chloroflexota bacterium]MBU1751603.1 ABC transporter ATP-binding protein/permease [Chloroflexota bacterium]
MLLGVLLLGSISLQLVNPQITRYFIDAAQTGRDAQSLVWAALLFLGVALVQQVVGVTAAYVSENVGWLTTNDLRTDLAAHCLRLDMSFHNAHTPGEMIERIDGDVTALSNFFSQFVIQIVGNALLLAGILILLYQVDWRVGLALSAFVLAALVVLVRLRHIGVPFWTAERQASADLFGFLEERLAGTEDIRANGAQAYVMRHFYRLMRALMHQTLKAGLVVNFLFSVMLLLFAVGNAAALALGGYLFFTGTLTIGTVYLVYFYTNMLMRPIDQISQQIQELQRAGAGITRVRELLFTRPQIRDSGTIGLPAGPLVVDFQDVSFSYKEQEVVLDDLTFHLRPGTVLGLLGRTGSGKSTLTRLIFRLYDPDQGVVCLGHDGALTDLRQVPLIDLRQHVGIVTQEVQLFQASVRDNLTFFDDRVSDERIRGAIQELGLDPWLQSLPEGLDTELESGGGGLSAGEAQLLAFTRILLHDPGLVILDEASSRLDPATEHLIERAVERLVQDRTAIIVAHRLGTVQRADEIMILEHGRISEHGPRQVLVNDPTSRFYGLLQTGLEEVLA